MEQDLSRMVEAQESLALAVNAFRRIVDQIGNGLVMEEMDRLQASLTSAHYRLLEIRNTLGGWAEALATDLGSLAENVADATLRASSAPPAVSQDNEENGFVDLDKTHPFGVVESVG